MTVFSEYGDKMTSFGHMTWDSRAWCCRPVRSWTGGRHVTSRSRLAESRAAIQERGIITGVGDAARETRRDNGQQAISGRLSAAWAAARERLQAIGAWAVVQVQS
jgi:hypothetical protein